MRRVHFSAERLSPEGLALVHRGLRDKWTYARMIAELKKSTGEKLAPSSLQRYAARHEATRRGLQQVQEEAAAIVAELKTGSITAAEMATALVARALFERRADLSRANPIELSREAREREKLQLQREQLELDRKKFEAMKDRLKQVREKAEKVLTPGKGHLAPEVVAKIREIYDLGEA